jgi:hypothetical protein
MPSLEDLYLTYRQTGTGAGTCVIGNALAERYARGSGVNRNQFPWYFKFRSVLRDTTSGGVCAVKIQTAPDAATWTDAISWTLTIPTGAVQVAYSKLFKTPLVSGAWPLFVRSYITSLLGGSAPALDMYLTAGGYGT